jgi:Spy/CpxP family protein refolding chaperone
MKKLLVAVSGVVLAMSLAGSDVQAQGGGGGRGMGGARMMETMMQGITLTDVQKAKVDSIVAKYQKEMPQMTPGSPPSPEDRQKRMELMRKQQDEIKAVLTAEQKAVFDKNLANMPGRRPGA